MTQLPTNRTAANSVAEHTADHNSIHAQHNELDGHAADTAAHDLDATIAAAIDALVAAAPGTLDTLNELAAALGDDADFAATITTALAGKSATSHDHDADYEAAGAAAAHAADTSTHGFANGAALLDESAHDALDHAGLTGVGAAHPDLSAHNTLGLATQAEIDDKVNGTVRLTVATSAPGSPATNDLWLDSDATSSLEHTHSGALVAADMDAHETDTTAHTTVAANRQTASYGLVLADAGKVVEMNVASGNNLTVPLNATQAFPVGTVIELFQYGAGQTTVVATGGVTILSSGGKLKLTGQYSGASLRKIATDEWQLAGDIAT